MATLGWLPADWQAPPGVSAGCTTRAGGVSRGPFASLNLGDHVGDAPGDVAANRAQLRAALALPGEPLWLRQVHGNGVVIHDGAVRGVPEADAAVAFAPGRVLAVLTADCLPVAFASADGSRVGIAHAGWRGLAGGVLEATIDALRVPPQDLVAWLGPAIGPDAFEVGDEVRAAFVGPDAGAAAHFVANARGRWQADLAALARRRLAAAGLVRVAGAAPCTHADPARFYSFRRDSVTGRLATLVWAAGTRRPA